MLRVPTIRSRLATLAVACILPASVLVGCLILYNYNLDRSRTARTTIETARAMTHAVDMELAGIQSSLLALATSPYLASDDLAAFYGQAHKVLNTQRSIANIVVMDGSSRQRLNTLRPFGDALPTGADPVAAAVFKKGAPLTTDVFVGPVTRKYMLASGVPVFRDDKIVYILAAGIAPERLSRLLTEQALDKNWVVSIFDSTGTIVARTHQPERFVGTKGVHVLLARMAEIPDGFLETKTLEGIPVLSAFSKSAVSNWSVAIGIPTAVLTTELTSRLWWLVFGTATLLALSLAAAWTIGSTIAGPVSGLVEPALALGYGQAVSVPTLPLKEADAVGRALTMASELLIAAQTRATHDPLTGLANRALFQDMLEQQLAICQRSGDALAVLYVDLDGFKLVNDRHGHAAGDEVLCAVAGRLKNTVRAADLAVRLGGDEFALILVQTDTKGAEVVAQKVIDQLSAPYPVAGNTSEANISASVGIAVYPLSAATGEELLQSADEAMYRAKTSGKCCFVTAA